MPKLLNCVQGTEEWCNARAGKPTASNFDQIITPGGAPSKSASAYCNRLLVEVMLGRPLVGVMTNWMQRGKDMEAEAVKFYELMKDVDTVPVGIFLTNDERIGASPDRLVGDDGLLECKCPSDEVASKYLSAHIDALLGSDSQGGAAAAYRCQLQGQLFVSEREWVDVIAYYPGLPSAITRVGRDEKFIAAMKVELYKFLEMFEARLAKLKDLGYLDGIAAKPKKEEPEIGAFGVSEEDIDQYIAQLKRTGVLREASV